jgi:hypothetical protein
VLAIRNADRYRRRDVHYQKHKDRKKKGQKKRERTQNKDCDVTRYDSEDLEDTDSYMGGVMYFIRMERGRPYSQ